MNEKTLGDIADELRDRIRLKDEMLDEAIEFIHRRAAIGSFAEYAKILSDLKKAREA